MCKIYDYKMNNKSSPCMRQSIASKNALLVSGCLTSILESYIQFFETSSVHLNTLVDRQSSVAHKPSAYSEQAAKSTSRFKAHSVV